VERAVVDLPLATLGRLGYQPLLQQVELQTMQMLRWDRDSSVQIIRCRPLRPDLTVEKLLRNPLVASGRLLRAEEGRWTLLATLRSTSTLRALYQPFQDVFLEPVFEVRKGRLRLSLLGDGTRLRAFMAAAREADLHYEVVRFEPAESDPRNPMGGLTPRQQQILRAAVEMGYFENPKRVRLHDLGRLLGMDKSTVGETLRRAEKRVFETLLGAA
jgi:predicted DNA binding protein